ncbi:hypothetical protein NL526_28385, partial [Klebsiella pneumoniae]|nr:hypothetical protein [Klebsiella pneumoniae]
MFYIPIPDSRAFQLADTAPLKGNRYEALSTEVVVHTKMHGSHDKAKPYVLRGVARHGRLLV